MPQHIPITLPEVIAAAILHDIGKMIQRTRGPAYRDKEDEENLCPFSSKYNHFTHLHVLYTSGFIKAKQHIFPEEMNPERVATLAAKHHQPDTPYQWIIAEADRLSSGCDRSKKEILETDNQYFEQPARCIFDKIDFKNSENQGEHFYPLLPLTPDNTFPTGNSKITAADYQKLLADFEKDIEKLRNLKTGMFFETLDSLLEHYCWSIPSSTIDEPDISLYDHLRTTAALAAVIYRYHSEKGNIEDSGEIQNRSTEKYLLVSGDLSGIQHYLFSIHKPKFAAKILRAKSFELQVMMNSVSHYILNSLELPDFCQIMNAGGRFLLLLPNTDKTETKLNVIREQVNRYCIQRFMGELSLNISQGVTASGNSLMQKNSATLFRHLTQDVQQAKLNRFQNILKQPDDHILDYYYDAFQGSGDECPLCGKRPRSGSELCKVCANLRDVGAALPKSKFAGWLPTDKGPSDAFSYPWETSFRLAGEMEKLPADCFPAAINEYTPGFPLIKTPYHVPTRRNGDILTFEELGEKATGAPHIAMFKADVDNLGAIFTIGMKDRISLSRFATLSRMMNYFFTSFLNEFVATEFPDIYIVYSGGDDLCLIGPWSDIVAFAEKLQEKFSDFTGPNPSVTLSAGIALAHTGTPVLNIAREAEDGLEQAKKSDKNRSTLFGVTVPWPRYRELLSLSGKWAGWIDSEGKKINLAIIYRLLGYSRAKKSVDKGGIQGINMLWKSHLGYDAERNIGDKTIRESFLQDALQYIDHLPIPASIILYQNRQGGKK